MPVTPPPASGGGGGGSVVFFEEGSAVGTATNLNFVGAGVTATYSGGTAIATIPGGTASGSIVFLDEGTVAGTATHFNTVGSSGTVSFSGGTATLTLSGGGGDFTHIQTIECAAASASITFSGISGSYRHLVIKGVGRTNQTGVEVASLDMRVGQGAVDTASNYAHHRAFTGSGASSSSLNSNGTMSVGMISAGNSTAVAYSAVDITIYNYAGTAAWRTVMAQSYHPAHPEYYENRGGGVWKSVGSAIDTILLQAGGGSLVAGSVYSLYGVT